MYSNLYLLGWLQSRNTHSQQILEENRQALILFAIIILFFVCHLPRNFLNLHEALTFEQKKRDYLHGCRGVPLWILIIGLVSHILLTCNSALNFLLYCVMSDVFRHELFLLLKKWCRGFKNGFCGKSEAGNEVTEALEHPTVNGVEMSVLPQFQTYHESEQEHCERDF